MYADIIIDITHEKLDKVFQYRIPSELEGILEVGTEVIVPFGRGNKETGGYVIGFSETADYDEDKIKFILRRAEDKRAIKSKLVALAAWMKESYGGTMIQALRTVLPIKKQEKIKKKRTVRLLLSEEEGRERLDIFLHKNQKFSLSNLRMHFEIRYVTAGQKRKKQFLRRSRNRRFLFLHKIMRMVTGTRILSME